MEDFSDTTHIDRFDAGEYDLTPRDLDYLIIKDNNDYSSNYVSSTERNDGKSYEYVVDMTEPSFHWTEISGELSDQEALENPENIDDLANKKTVVRFKSSVLKFENDEDPSIVEINSDENKIFTEVHEPSENTGSFIIILLNNHFIYTSNYPPWRPLGSLERGMGLGLTPLIIYFSFNKQ